MEIDLVMIIFAASIVSVLLSIFCLDSLRRISNTLDENNIKDDLENIDMMSEKQYKDIMKVVCRTEVLLEQLLKFEEESGKTNWNSLQKAFKPVHVKTRVDLNE